jgi:hypothetical protein
VNYSAPIATWMYAEFLKIAVAERVLADKATLFKERPETL